MTTVHAPPEPKTQVSTLLEDFATLPTNLQRRTVVEFAAAVATARVLDLEAEGLPLRDILRLCVDQHLDRVDTPERMLATIKTLRSTINDEMVVAADFQR